MNTIVKPYEVNIPMSQLPIRLGDIDIWLGQNMKGDVDWKYAGWNEKTLSDPTNFVTFYFQLEEDAIAFKLRWI